VAASEFTFEGDKIPLAPRQTHSTIGPLLKIHLPDLQPQAEGEEHPSPPDATCICIKK
jgi:hypothetical protein